MAFDALVIGVPCAYHCIAFFILFVFGVHRLLIVAILVNVILGVLLHYRLRFFADIFVSEADGDEVSVQTVFQHLVRRLDGIGEVDDNIARGFGGVIKEVCRLVNLYTIEL